MEIDERLKQIEELEIFLKDKGEIPVDILNKLGWSEESLNDEFKTVCTKDPGHWVPESTLAHHEEICAWTKEGYTKEEMVKQPPSSQFFYQKATSVIPVIIDKELQASILLESTGENFEKKFHDEIPNVPRTVDRSVVELTPEQRLAIYDYVVKEGKAANKPKNVTVEDLLFDFGKKDEQEGRPKTQLEILAELRDYKRRRQSYRAKNVHITKKSYTELMKEVIENQITYLSETRKQETCEKTEDVDSELCTKDKDGTEEKTDHKRREGSYDHRRDDSKPYRAHSDRSESSSPRHHKHKRERSRSRSRSRTRHKHKKSHHKKSH
ncbi:U11/U12 small nuclear ribonucleoprotein, partial [Stegodyphus mimosarum]